MIAGNLIDRETLELDPGASGEGAPATPVEEESDPLIASALDFERSAQWLDLEQWIVQRLRHPERAITVSLPLKSQTQSTCRSLSGFRVQHFGGRGPTLGEIRFSREADLIAVKAAAMSMTWTMALLDLPFGGAAGAVVCNPESMTEKELEAVAKQYVYGLRGVVGAYSDILAPGAGCNAQTMAWMLDGNVGESGRLKLGAVMGKPSSLFGMPGYYEATALGILALLEQAWHEGLAGRKIAIQGFGAIGASVARLLHERGAQIVALADISGGLISTQGLDIPEIERHIAHSRVLFGYPGAEAACNEDVLEAQCDALILAATERQITAANAESIRAALVLEATHGAVTLAANEILAERAKRTVPEILATGGRAVAAYVEWMQNTQAPQLWPVGRGFSEAGRTGEPIPWIQLLKHRVGEAYHTILDHSLRHHMHLRQSAHVVAVERVANGMRMRQ